NSGRETQNENSQRLTRRNGADTMNEELAYRETGSRANNLLIHSTEKNVPGLHILFKSINLPNPGLASSKRRAKH
ncbi:MAG: hypothetical protein Q4C95_08060, partial [Planctomycetia bacterium]|nr:hypothetical protein [Planctomycetia bacterium]